MRREIDGTDADGTLLADRIGRVNGSADWSVPEDPRERRRIRNVLIALAAALPIMQLLRLLFR
jgi:hypothetical protein